MPEITTKRRRTTSTSSYFRPWMSSIRTVILSKQTGRYGSLSEEEEEEEEFDGDYSNEMKQNIQELWQAQNQKTFKDNPIGNVNQQNPPDLPDLYLFEKQMNQNISGPPQEETILIDLPFPNYYGAATGDAARRKESNNDLPSNYYPPIDLDAATGLFAEENPVDDGNDGFHIDPDIYSRSRDLISVDESMDILTRTNEVNTPDLLSSVDGRKAILERLLQAELEARRKVPQPPSSTGDDEFNELNDAWTLIQKEASKPFNASKAEELHRQVFEDETGFLSQSEAFQQALVDPVAAERVTVERRNARSNERQDQARKILLANMAKFEQELLEKDRIGSTICSRCRCPLVETDYDFYPQLWMRQRNLTALCETCYNSLIASTKDLQKLQPRQPPYESETNQVRQAGSNSRPQTAAYSKSRSISSQQYTNSTRSPRPIRSNDQVQAARPSWASSKSLGQQPNLEQSPPEMSQKGNMGGATGYSAASAQRRLEGEDETIGWRQEPSLGDAQASPKESFTRSTNLSRTMVNSTTSQAVSRDPAEDPDSGETDAA
jgi:hypothetical protein